MSEIRVTAEQKRRLDEIREDLAAAYVDGYGHVRVRDAVEYLLDTYTPPDGAHAEAPEGDAATETQQTPASEPGTGADPTEAGVERRCAICGTDVDPDDTECPLCRSRDLVPVDADVNDGGDGRSDADGGGGVAADVDARPSEATDEAVDRLREFQTGQRTDGTDPDEPAAENGSDGDGAVGRGPP